MFEQFSIDPQSLYLYVIKPAFADLVPGNMPFDGTLHEFTLMDNVSSKRPIIDIRRVKNILQRRDASCDMKYSKVAGTSTRQIEVTELQAGVKHCKHEFYQGCLKDWRGRDPLFGNKAIDGFFKDAIKTDIASNAYFGDVSRTISGGAQWSTGAYDGIFSWIRKYIDGGVIPADQTFTIPSTDLRANPSNAYAVVKALYDKQNDIMRSFPDGDKVIIVDQQIFDGYKEYLKSLGGQYDITLYTNGVGIPSYNSVPVQVEPLWSPILTELAGASNRHAAILTLRGNFVFGTDSKYGEEDENEVMQALRIWYEYKDLSFYWQMFLKAGTQIALPEHVVVGMSNFNL